MSDCPHDSMSGDEGPVVDLGRMPTRWRCDECGAIVHDSGPPATPVYAARTTEISRLASDAMERAAYAARCFGPGTTDGGRAEAGWLPAGRILGDGPDITPEPTIDARDA